MIHVALTHAHTQTLFAYAVFVCICVFHFHEFDSLMESYSEMKLLPSAIQLGFCSRRRQIITEYEKINESISVFDALNTHKHTGAHTHRRTHSRAMLLLLQ